MSRGPLTRAGALFALFALLMVPATATGGPESNALLADGDRLFDTRDEADHADRAVQIYKKLAESEPKNEAALWRLSRSYRWRGDLAGSSDEKLAAYKESQRWAEKAIEASPESVGGHLMLGIAYGRIGETQGVMKSLSLISPIKSEMNLVLSRDPQNDTAHHVLGVLYRKVPGLMGGSTKKSIELLETAVRLNPANTSHLLELAESYIEKGDEARAKSSLKTLLAISNPSDRVQSKLDRAEAEKLLADLPSQ
ncbi:MAG TPA: tetratricopeptide repeat protein [Candidatus Manganitrophaceae bacterium]|nr:tetratricopeptide repeat protein [Candidatus Manganitrophaceae bacterium]